MLREKIEMDERIEIEKEKLQFQLKMKELELQERAKPKSSEVFDVTIHMRLVPPFQESEVDKYFLRFETVAENLKWPKEHWTLLLQRNSRNLHSAFC